MEVNHPVTRLPVAIKLLKLLYHRTNPNTSSKYFCQLFIGLLMSNVMLFDWGIQYLNIKESTNQRRLLTGLVGGFGYSTLHLHLYYYIYRKLKELIHIK